MFVNAKTMRIVIFASDRIKEHRSSIFILGSVLVRIWYFWAVKYTVQAFMVLTNLMGLLICYFRPMRTLSYDMLWLCAPLEQWEFVSG